MKGKIFFLLVLIVLAFIFADSLYYLSGRWQEKVGKTKQAVRTYQELVKKYPRSCWVKTAKKSLARLEGIEKSGLEEEVSPGRKGSTSANYPAILNKTKSKIKSIEEEKQAQYEEYLEE